MRSSALILWLATLCSTAYSFAHPPFLVPYRKGNLWGYATIEGKVVITPTFSRSYFFTEDSVARVEVKGLTGYINRQGKFIIKPQYKNASDFSLGMATVELKNERFCIDLTGKREACNETMIEEIIPPTDQQKMFIIEKTAHGYALLHHAQDTLGTFDKIDIVERYIFPQTNYFAIVERNGLKGAYHTSGELVVPIRYKKIDIFDMDSYKALLNERWGVMTFDSTLLLPFTYDSIRKVSNYLFLEDGITRNNHFIVGNNGKFGIVNSNNEIILPVDYDIIQTPQDCNCPTEYVVKQNGWYGLANDSGQIVIRPKYASIDPFYSATITKVVTATGKEGYINRNGFEYFIE